MEKRTIEGQSAGENNKDAEEILKPQDALDAVNDRTSSTVAKHNAAHETTVPAGGRDRPPHKGARAGKHVALTWSDYTKLIAAARDVDEGLAHILVLARRLGLNWLEAITCGGSLKKWKRLIENSESYLPVEGSSKDGCVRHVEVLDEHRAETFLAIHDALEFCRDRNFELITGRHGDLKSARSHMKFLVTCLPEQYRRRVSSLRRAYASDYWNARCDSELYRECDTQDSEGTGTP